MALQQNEILDVFYDDYLSLADDETTFGAKSDNYLKVMWYIMNYKTKPIKGYNFTCKRTHAQQRYLPQCFQVRSDEMRISLLNTILLNLSVTHSANFHSLAYS